MNLSSGIIAFRKKESTEVLIAHPGGPFFRNKLDGIWTFPKGALERSFKPAEKENTRNLFKGKLSYKKLPGYFRVEIEETAPREFYEETGFPAGEKELLFTNTARFQGGKYLILFRAAITIPEAFKFSSNTMSFEYPRGTGRIHSYPEVGNHQWVSLDEARKRLHPVQADALLYFS